MTEGEEGVNFHIEGTTSKMIWLVKVVKAVFIYTLMLLYYPVPFFHPFTMTLFTWDKVLAFDC